MSLIRITLASTKAVKLVNTDDIHKVYVPTQSKDHADSAACIIYKQPHPTRVGSNEFDFVTETPEQIWEMSNR